MSATYLDWVRRNLALNGFDQPHHRLVRADCLAWLQAHTARDRPAGRFGLIFLDPPPSADAWTATVSAKALGGGSVSNE